MIADWPAGWHFSAPAYWTKKGHIIHHNGSVNVTTHIAKLDLICNIQQTPNIRSFFSLHFHINNWTKNKLPNILMNSQVTVVTWDDQIQSYYIFSRFPSINSTSIQQMHYLRCIKKYVLYNKMPHTLFKYVCRNMRCQLIIICTASHVHIL